MQIDYPSFCDNYETIDSDLYSLEAEYCRDFICCEVRLADLYDLLQHYEECHQQECQRPQILMPSIFHIPELKQNPKPKRVFKCTLCDKAYANKSGLKYHQTTKHKKRKRF